MKIEGINRWLVLGANVGVLVGVILLVVEIRQNSELMRAEIHSIRAEGKADRQMSLANDGEIARILAKLLDNGFPGNQDAILELPLEEHLRVRLMYSAVAEVMVNWYIQCQHELLIEETCDVSYRRQIVDLMPFVRAARVDLNYATPGFVADVRRILEEEGLPAPNDDGSWPRPSASPD